MLWCASCKRVEHVLTPPVRVAVHVCDRCADEIVALNPPRPEPTTVSTCTACHHPYVINPAVKRCTHCGTWFNADDQPQGPGARSGHRGVAPVAAHDDKAPAPT